MPDTAAGKALKKADRLSGIVEYAIKESGLLAYHKEQDEVAGTQKVSKPRRAGQRRQRLSGYAHRALGLPRGRRA
ncbi:hypothetical protein MASR2M48_20970 [Spirochaetota bacterium]